MRWREFFVFTRSDRSVLTVMVVAIVVAACLFSGALHSPSVTSLISSDSLAAQSPAGRGGWRTDRQQREYYSQYALLRKERFFFDPNTADSTQLLRLGLRPWMVRNIYKYRRGGGNFRSPEDFAQIYGLTTTEFEELRPYIRIQHDFTPAAETYPRTEHDTLRFPLKLQQGELISLNSADTAALKKIPGVGSYFARQIQSYRRRLGGFARKEQLMEIDGFPEEALDYVVVDTAQVKRLPVNELTLDQLRRHPYITFFQARAITDYRRLHGPIDSLGQLRLMREFSADEIARLQPYLSF